MSAIENTGGEDPNTGELYRVVDGEAGGEVSCTVRQTGDTTFEFEARLRKDRAVDFYARGTLTTTGGTIDISESDSASGLPGTSSAVACEVDLIGPPEKYIGPGAVWAAFRCPEFRDDVVQCSAEGTFIFENCAQ